MGLLHSIGGRACHLVVYEYTESRYLLYCHAITWCAFYCATQRETMKVEAKKQKVCPSLANGTNRRGESGSLPRFVGLSNRAIVDIGLRCKQEHHSLQVG